MKVYACFDLFPGSGPHEQEEADDYLKCIWDDKDKLINCLIDLLKDKKYNEKYYINVSHKASEKQDYILINAYGDMADGYCPTIQKRKNVHIETYFIIKQVEINSEIVE